MIGVVINEIKQKALMNFWDLIAFRRNWMRSGSQHKVQQKSAERQECKSLENVRTGISLSKVKLIYHSKTKELIAIFVEFIFHAVIIIMGTMQKLVEVKK